MSTRNRIAATMLAAWLAAPAAALAHGTAKHVMGTATAVEAERLVVETRGGETVSLEIHDGTQFRDPEGRARERAELRAGDRVVVDFHSKDDSRIADEIRFAHPEAK